MTISREVLLPAFLVFDICACSPFQGSAQATPLPNTGHGNATGAQIVTTHYPTDDLVIANVVATDPPYRADDSGAKDATFAIQAALNAVHDAGGGVVWLPAGTYRITSSLLVPGHVTLRGDWRDPDSGTGSYGSVLLAAVASGGETDPGLIRISGSAGVNGLTVFYPNESISNPIPYPYVFEILGSLISGDGYMMATVEHVTLLNAYRGISAGAGAVHEMHRIRKVKGTALSTAMYLQDSADVSHSEDVTFSPHYWATLDRSLSNTRPAEADVEAWTRSHATGLRMGGLDWDQFMNLTLSDFNVGIDMVPGRRVGMTASFFGINVQNSHVAFHIVGPDIYTWFGLNIANSTFQANQGPDAVAVQVEGDQPAASLLMNGVTLDSASGTPMQINGDLYVALSNCRFETWGGNYALTASRGTVALEGTTFVPPLTAATRGIQLLPGVTSATVLGSIFSGSSTYLLDNRSSGVVVRQDSGFLFVHDRVSAYSFAAPPRPLSRRLFDVKSAPYGARADGSHDDTSAIQRALSDAGRAGGGTVYLPAGIYAVKGHLTVPAGVELRGSDDVPHRAMFLESAPGTILFAYEGRATTDPGDAAPFILLNGNHSGVRGLGIHYPEQATDSVGHIVAYPWTIRGNGTGVYAFDISFTNAYQGIDFATYPTSEHYVNAVNGFALKTGVWVGQSTVGWLEDTHFNVTAWIRAQGLPNLMPSDSAGHSVGLSYSRANLRPFVITNGARNEHVVGDSDYGALTGLSVQGDAQLDAINIGVDGGPNSFAVENTGQGGAAFINMQGCGCEMDGVGLAINAGMVDVFNLLTIGAYRHAIAISGGTYQVEGAGLALTPLDAVSGSYALMTGGSGVLAGTYFQDAGAQVTVSGASTIANLWGNTGAGGFTASFVNGAPVLVSGNIPR